MPCAFDRRSMRPKCDWAAWFLVFLMPGLAIGQPDVTLVDKLATSNEPATIEGKPGRERATWSQFDVRESKRVDSAISKVVLQSEDLWADLVGHLGDERYSETVGIDAGYPRNWSVGDICQEIIGETLSEAYYRQMAATKEIFHQYRIPSFAKDKVKLREWCLARKDRKLFELQVEACKLAITEIKASEMDMEQKRQLITKIYKEIERLEKSRMAVRCSLRL